MGKKRSTVNLATVIVNVTTVIELFKGGQL